MSIDPKFVVLTADVLENIFDKTYTAAAASRTAALQYSNKKRGLMFVLGVSNAAPSIIVAH